MKEKLAAWIGKARRLESAIGDTVDGSLAQVRGRTSLAPLETVLALVDVIVRETQPAGRGRHVFPFTHVRAAFAASSRNDIARLTVACEGPPTLEVRVADRLRDMSCHETPIIAVTFVDEPSPSWGRPEFGVEFSREQPAPTAVDDPTRLELAVIRGTAEPPACLLASDVLTIGRGVEVRDTRGLLLRTNHLAFVDDGTDVNATVSRQHAQIRREPGGKDFRLFDDAAQETRVVREGRGIAVPRGRGLRLRAGDVIVLGRAQLCVRCVEGDGEAGSDARPVHEPRE